MLMPLRPMQLPLCDTSLLTAYAERTDLRSAVADQNYALLCLLKQPEAERNSLF